MRYRLLAMRPLQPTAPTKLDPQPDPEVQNLLKRGGGMFKRESGLQRVWCLSVTLGQQCRESFGAGWRDRITHKDAKGGINHKYSTGGINHKDAKGGNLVVEVVLAVRVRREASERVPLPPLVEHHRRKDAQPATRIQVMSTT